MSILFVLFPIFSDESNSSFISLEIFAPVINYFHFIISASYSDLTVTSDEERKNKT